jgi:hypothetical protein
MASSFDVPGEQRREEPRYAVDVDATLRAYRLPTVTAHLVDVSKSGGLLRTEGHDFRVGDEVHVDATLFEAVATVAWTREAFLGVSFHRHLDDARIVTLRRAGRA